jgi:H+/Cl- antiporter ClcA
MNRVLGRNLIIVCSIGILCGIASALFLASLQWVTAAREEFSWLVMFLPFAGFCSALMYQRFGPNVESGANLLFDEIQEPKKVIPAKMGWLVWAGSLISHLGGASVGREGTAVQMGGCIADQIQSRLNSDGRHIFLMAGVAGGFGSVFGVPFAGFFFALEVLRMPWSVRCRALPYCLISAFIAHYVTLACGIHHTPYPHIDEWPSSTYAVIALFVLGALCGVMALAFVQLSHWVQKISQRIFTYNPYRVMVGGAIVSLALLVMGTRYAGLGVPAIVDSFQNRTTWWDALTKLALTALSIGTGFKGGEVTPLLFVGSSFGSWFAPWANLPLALSAGVGFVAVLAGALNSPLACAMMAAELLGWKAGLCALPACYLSYFFSGHHGIYSAQIRLHPKRWHLAALMQRWSNLKTK